MAAKTHNAVVKPQQLERQDRILRILHSSELSAAFTGTSVDCYIVLDPLATHLSTSLNHVSGSGQTQVVQGDQGE